MAEEPENIVLAHLREIRSELRDVRTELRDVKAKQDEHGKTLEWIAEVAYLGVGIATATNYKLDQIVERMDGFEQRIHTVEARSPS